MQNKAAGAVMKDENKKILSSFERQQNTGMGHKSNGESSSIPTTKYFEINPQPKIKIFQLINRLIQVQIRAKKITVEDKLIQNTKPDIYYYQYSILPIIICSDYL